MGAVEIDSVINVGKLLDGDYEAVYEEIKAISQVCTAENTQKICHKVIIEASCLNSEDLITDAALLCAIGGANFVKTSTGFHAAGGATAAHVRLMRNAVGEKLDIKAAGGIRDGIKMAEMITAGAGRIGTSGACGFKWGVILCLVGIFGYILGCF